MNRKVLVLTFIISIFGFGLFIPTTNFDSITSHAQDNSYELEYTPSGIGDNIENFVDQISNLHLPTDIGTHSVFADLQDFGLNYNQMTETDTGSAGFNLEDNVDQQSNLHAPADIGTHSNFAEMQDTDSIYDSLTEADTGGAVLQSWTSPTSFVDPSNAWNNESYAYDESTATGADTSLAGGAQTSTYLELNLPSVITSSAVRYYIRSVTQLSGLTIDVYDTGWANIFNGVPSTDAWTNVTFTQQSVSAVRVNVSKAGGGPATYYFDEVDVLNITTLADYNLDLEVGWTGADYSQTNEELCIYGGTQGAEALRVDVWNGAWINVISDLQQNQWNNVSISSYLTSSSFEIRFTDASGDSATQDTWQVEGVLLHIWTPSSTNYELDLEIGWTAADYDEQNEELCIYPVTGGGWPSEDIKVDVWNGAWTNVFLDLTPDQWNNVSISSYLTGIAFEIRFVGGTETGDATQNTWEIDAVLLHSWTPSYAPVNDQAPTLDNPSDTDNMYAQYLEYQVTAYVSDQNGFSDIAYLELGIWDNGETTEYCRFRYDEDTNTFSEQYDIGTVISLNTGSSTAIESGTDINATFYFIVDWDFPDSSDLVARCSVRDTQTLSDTDSYGSPSVTWDVETRLDYTGSLGVDDASGTADRGDLDSSFSFTGTIIYYTSVDDYPSSAAVDVWVSASEYGTNVGPWSDTDLASGVFDVTCYSDDVVGQDTYTVKVVEEGGLSTDPDLYYTTSATDTYIADQVQVQSYSVANSRVNVSDNVDIEVTLYYAYDSTAVLDGIVTINGASSTPQGAGVWRITDSEASVMVNTYDTVAYSGGTHGITTVDQNGQSQQVIWDQVIVISYTVVDDHVNINTVVSVNVTLQYDYDNSAVTDGTVTINGISASNFGSGVWGISATQVSVTAVTYNLVAVSGNTNGISSVNQNGQNQQVIWDQITAIGYSVSDPRVDINANVNVDVTIEYAYDSSPVIDGTVTINGNSASPLGAGVWRIVESQSSIQQVTYNIVACSGNTEGITSVNQNGQSTAVIWDRISVQMTSVDNNRVGVGTSVEIRVRLWLEYDSTFLGSGDTVTLDGAAMTWDAANSWFNISRSQASVGFWLYFVNSSTESGFGITELYLNSKNVSVIWDRVQVVSYSVSDSRVNINDNMGLDVTLIYDYDNTPVTDGTVTINGISATHLGTGVWNITDSKATVQLFTYDTVATSGNTHGISVVDQNTQTQDVIWDRVQVQSYSVTDNRVNVNANVNLDVTLVYDYDNSAVTDGTVTINGASATHQVAGVWRAVVNESTVSENTYNLVACSDNTYNISTVDQNGQSQQVIWDQITVRSYSVLDSRVNIGDDVNIDVTIEYEYDDTPVLDGTVTINGASATPQGLGVWRITDSEASVMLNSYDLVVCSGNANGISSINQNTQSVDVIWDRVQVQSYSVSDSRVGLNDNVNIDVTIVYDYDNSAVTDGTVTINGLSATHQAAGVWRVTDTKATVQLFTYNTVACTGTYYGISTVDQNSQSTAVIWDQLVVTIGVGDSTPINGVQANFTLIVTFDYDDSSCTSYQIVIDRNATWWHSFDFGNISQFTDTNANVIYLYNASLVSSESTYGITVFTTNTQQVTWSLAPNEIPVNDSGPVLTNGDDTDFLYARYRYYIITTSVSDPDGYIDISYVQLSLFPDDFPILYWTIRYTRATDTFSVEFGGLVVTIDAMSNAVGVGDTLTVTWYIKIGWDHPYAFNIDTQQFVTDGTDNDSDFYESNWNIETRLDYSTSPYLSDDRGNINTSDLIGSGSVTYYGSSHSPLANETDVWVVRDGVEAWSGDLSAGSFSISSIGSPATTGLNNYTFKVVPEGSGFVGTDLYHTSSLNDTFITDRIEIYEAGVVDGRININSDCDVWWRARYEYDDTPIQSGLILDLNGSRTLIWYAGGLYWRWQETSVSPSSAWFDVASASESTYGLTEWFATTSLQQVIWDALIISISDPSDQRVNIGTNATGIIVSAVYVFDSAVFDGSFTLNNTNYQYASPQLQWYTVSAASGDTHGISVIQINDATFCIWDRVKLTSITATTPSVDTGVSVEIRVTLVYEFDNSPVTDGTVYLNNGPVSMTYNPAGYWTASVGQTASGSYTFTLDSVSGNTHGVTTVNTDGLSVEIEWVGVPGFVPDTMTLMLVGGGAGIALIGAAIVVSRRRRGVVSVDVSEIDTSGPGIPEVAEEAPPEEPVSVEIEEEPIPEPEVESEEIEPSELEAAAEVEVEDAEVESAVVEEPVELEPEEVELPPMEEELAEVEVEEFEIETESEILDETTIEPEIEVEVEETEMLELDDQIPEEIVETEPEVVEEAEVVELIEEPIEPEIEPVVKDYIPEEFIEPEPVVDMSKLTKKELLDLIPDDIKASTSPSELKRLTKSELISLVESFQEVDE